MNLARHALLTACRKGTKARLAAEIGVSRAFLTAVMKGRKRPGPKVLAFFGLEAYEAYRRVRPHTIRPN